VEGGYKGTHLLADNDPHIGQKLIKKIHRTKDEKYKSPANLFLKNCVQQTKQIKKIRRTLGSGHAECHLMKDH
jgi:hypothetical protein